MAVFGWWPTLTALVLGAKDILVATHGERRRTAVLAARLEDVEVGSSADRLPASVGEDGVTVTGFPTAVAGTTGRGSYFVGLDSPDVAKPPAPRLRLPSAAQGLNGGASGRIAGRLAAGS